jgi:hypothetical protein
MVNISQSELEKTLAGGRKKVHPESPKPEVRRRTFSAPRGKKIPPCVITQDELDRTLGKGDS